MAKLTFFGAAQNVTGSCYLLESNGTRILVDCGLYQERDFTHRNWDPFPVDPAGIHAMVLTHAHLDHCGRIPRLVQQGFAGSIFCTSATAEIASIVMRDAGKIQEEDMAYKKRRHAKEGRTSPHPYEPLYTKADAEEAEKLLKSVSFEHEVEVVAGITATFIEAGHILGAASVRMRVHENGSDRTILFSGDIGRNDMPILRDPQPVGRADYALLESTYGNRIHERNDDIPDRLAAVVNAALAAGGNVVIPSFAVERTQDVIYHLYNLLKAGKIPQVPIFVDSPMAIRVTDVFMKHPELLDEEAKAIHDAGKSIADYPGLKLTRSVEESKAINRMPGTSIIIAGSGMCTGGRVKHHLVSNIMRPESTVLFVGYQAVGTLGRHVVDGAEEVRILGGDYAVRAKIVKMGGFSGHADQRELLAWMGAVEGPPQQVFITHGELDAARTLAGLVRDELGLPATVPAYQDSVVLE